MKRVFIAALVCAALFGMAHRRASATVEFCPASLDLEEIAAHSDSKPVAALYAFDLSAFGPRTISATLVFDTSAGWFTVDVPDTTLVGDGKNWHSPTMYVQFPKPVTINHRWVYSAKTSGDGSFGWARQGTVTCDPPGNRPVILGLSVPSANDLTYLAAPPASNSVILSPIKQAPLLSATCAQAFSDPEPLHTEVPRFSARDLQDEGNGVANIIVAIRADGSVADAWLWQPLENDKLAREVLRAARASTYSAGLAYCKRVPSFFVFQTHWSDLGD
jgi:hypothetical protein